MTVTVVHRKNEHEAAGALAALVQAYELSAARLEVDDGWALSPALAERLEAGGCFIAVLPENGNDGNGNDGNGNDAPWFPWMAGFFRRSGTLVACAASPDAALSGAPDGAPFGESSSNLFSHVRFVAGVDACKALFDAEIGVWKEKARREDARRALLDAGIPWSDASFAARVGERDIASARLFLRGGFSPDLRDAAGVPLLSVAARAGDDEMVRLLLDAGADINAPARDRGGSALIDAALGKYHGIARALIQNGADVNRTTTDGQSALIISVGLADAPFVQMLLEAGAHTGDGDALGVSARKYAALFNNPAILALFEQYAPA